MTIETTVLGEIVGDNAVWARVDTGQALYRLLFDCGDNTISSLDPSEVLAFEHLFFSHLHMDHVGGFDQFFRYNFNRAGRPNVIWGPPETARIMHGRFQGFIWNLSHEMSGNWIVNDIYPDRIEPVRFELAEAFEVAHELEPIARRGDTVWENKDFLVDALQMDHLTPSMAYVVREKSRTNVNTDKLAELGLKTGPWLKVLKDSEPGADGQIDVNGTSHSLAQLRAELLDESSGESMAYLTDFLLDDEAMQRLTPFIRGCETVVCECQYSHADLELARNNRHMTATLSAQLARDAEVGKLLLFHLSRRYAIEEFAEILAEARAVFPKTHFAEHWDFSS